jgi:DNA-binding NarL/FixJ family response regulator
VLVCDDAPGFRIVMTTALEDAGMAVVGPAGTWDEAIAVAEAERPDAILADLWMPTFERESLARLCAAVPGSLVFVLSVLPPDKAAEAVEGIADVAGIYSKPDPPAAIAGRVREALAGSNIPG